MLIFERANSVEDAIRRGQRQVEQVRIKMGLQMDDKTFQAALLETQVAFVPTGGLTEALSASNRLC